MNNIASTFSYKKAASLLKEHRIKKELDLLSLASALEISEDELELYESGAVEIPASLLFCASFFLTGEPLAFLEASMNVQQSDASLKPENKISRHI